MVKKFTANCTFGGNVSPVTLYVGDPMSGSHPLGFQSKWLGENKGGSIPLDIMNSFKKLADISEKNKVSFEELCSYVIDELEQRNSIEGDFNKGAEFSGGKGQSSSKLSEAANAEPIAEKQPEEAQAVKEDENKADIPQEEPAQEEFQIKEEKPIVQEVNAEEKSETKIPDPIEEKLPEPNKEEEKIDVKDSDIDLDNNLKEENSELELPPVEEIPVVNNEEKPATEDAAINSQELEDNLDLPELDADIAKEPVMEEPKIEEVKEEAVENKVEEIKEPDPEISAEEENNIDDFDSELEIPDDLDLPDLDIIDEKIDEESDKEIAENFDKKEDDLNIEDDLAKLEDSLQDSENIIEEKTPEIPVAQYEPVAQEIKEEAVENKIEEIQDLAPEMPVQEQEPLPTEPIIEENPAQTESETVINEENNSAGDIDEEFSDIKSGGDDINDFSKVEEELKIPVADSEEEINENTQTGFATNEIGDNGESEKKEEPKKQSLESLVGAGVKKTKKPLKMRKPLKKLQSDASNNEENN